MTFPTLRWLRLVWFATLLVFAAVVFYVYGLRFFAWLESDASVTALLAAKTLHTGLPVVSDWYYANGDVWVMSPHLFAILPIAVLGLGTLSLLVAVAAGFVIELVVLVKLYARLCRERWLAAFAAMVTLMVWSTAHAAFVYIQLGYGFVTVVCLVSFVSFALLAVGPPTRPWRWAGASIFVALVAVQNPTRAFVFVLAPLLTGCVWPWRGLPRARRLAVAAAAITGCAMAFAVYVLVFKRAVTFSNPRGHIDFVVATDVDGIAHNLAMFGRGLVWLCAGSDESSLRAVPGMLLVAGAIAIVAREVLRSRSVDALRFLSVVVLAQLAALLGPLLIGNLLVSMSSVRYVMPSLLAVFGLTAILAVRALAEPGWWRRVSAAWLVLVPVAALVAAPSARPPTPEKYVWPDVAELDKIADELVHRGLSHGFANVLGASYTTLASGGAAWTCPVYFRDIIIPQRWLTDAACYTVGSLPERFYVIADRGGHDEAALRATLPAPIERFGVGPAYEVFVYRTADTSKAWLDLPLPELDRSSFPLRIAATHLQLIHGKVALESGRLVATGETGVVLFGPYIKLPRGRYKLRWSGSGVASPGAVKFLVTAEGKDVLAEAAVLARDVAAAPGQIAQLTFKLDRPRDAIEFIVYSENGGRAALDELVIERR